MSYSVDELFRFERGRESYAIKEYLKKDDPAVTELEIPAEYNGLRVRGIYEYTFSESQYLKRVVIPPSMNHINSGAFSKCRNLETVELPEGISLIYDWAFAWTKLKSVVLPKSLVMLCKFAFFGCEELERVIFNSAPVFQDHVFTFCEKLPAEIVLMDLVHSCDLGTPFEQRDFDFAFTDDETEALRYIRPDVLELALKNDCFRSADKFFMLKFLVKNGHANSLRLAEERGLFKNPDPIDEWIETAIQEDDIEFVAYLLDLKIRKFGFKGGDDFEL